ncbi:MAG TPA: S8 family serine peptidase [Ferruginibacter sp.]|nr:S8 family serine peptidase [Ferruginibacter sp.]
MKKFYSLLFYSFLLFSYGKITAQDIDIPVRFAAGNFITGNNIRQQSFQKQELQVSLFNNNYYVLVQFSKLPSLPVQQNLRKAGLNLETYIPGNAYLATVSNGFDFTKAGQSGIISINIIPAFYKIDKAFTGYRQTGNMDGQLLMAVSYYTSVNRSVVIEALLQLGALIMPTKFLETDVVFIRVDTGKVNAIAALPFVSYISLQSLTDRPLNYKSRGKHAVAALLSPSGKNLNGKGIVVGVGDNAEIVTQHIDFNSRVINRVPFPFSFHGIHVSGTVAGAGLLDPKHNGMAPRATIVSQYFSDIITAAPTYVADYNMVVTNNSYTNAQDSCAGSGAYDVVSNYIDRQMGEHEKLLHVFAAGNDGRNTCSPYPYGYATIKSGYQVAKNVLTVGSVDTLYAPAFFTSRGPVDDGRLKPEIVATGYRVFSTRHALGYEFSSGTSMASPIVAGVATLLNEQYRRSNAGAVPQASLIKAVLCNSAEDLGNPGPDFTFGFGNLNARRAADAIENNRFFISSTTPSANTISVPAGARRLKVMLYWADTAAAPNAAAALINDFDLTVVAPGNITHLPLILDTTPANVNVNAIPGVDRVNNIEQVVIDNPAAGDYDIHVNSFALPYGPQEYIVTYQVDMNGVTVEYPFGDEKLVPGEKEFIRWNAYGDEANKFTLEYFDGTSWHLISDTVPANAQSYEWEVPVTLSNDYLIRVSRNASVFSDQSDFSFSVIGQPLVTATVPCEGYVQLSWPAISGATNYDIWQLKADTMAIIGNTTSLTYIIPGLNNTTTYWFGVSANSGTVNGRRSISKSVIPATGLCSLTVFDNNMKAVSINAPVTGRQFTSSALTATEQIRFTIKNLDNAATSGSYDLYYKINNDPAVMETVSTVIAAMGSIQYTFATTADFSAPGIYQVKAWVKRTLDTQVLDDTTMVTVKHLANALLTLPVLDDFENALTKDYIVKTIGLDSIDRVDFNANTTRGRARTFVNTGFSRSGNKAITLDQFPVGALNTDSLWMTYNLGNYSGGQQLRLDFYYKNHGNENHPNNKVWIRGSDTSPWVLAYDLVANQAALGDYKHGIININDVLDTVLPAQPLSSSFQVKFAHQGFTSANLPDPVLDQDDGYTFDDVGIREVVNDIGITRIVSPSITGCGNAGSNTVSVEIKNYSSSTFINVPVYYNVNGGGNVMETIAALPPGITIHNFAAPVNLVLNTDYNFNFWVNEPSDTYNSNDSILNYNFRVSPVVSSFPYLQGFESDAGSWYSKGQNSSWQWGTPAKTIINKAANGTKAWVTGLTGNYNNNELSYLYSPCFNLSGLTQPVLSFSHIFRLEDATPADYTWVEYSTNGGVTWTRLGTNGGGINWYNDPTGKHQWRPSLRTWHVASVNIPTTGNNVRFRFVMSGDMAFNFEGVGIDDIHVFDKALIYAGTPITGITQTVSGTNWIHFNSGATRVVSMNANGDDLGSTTVDVYPYTGPVRVDYNQYYLNRNIVIRPANQPGTDISVRFYFTDAEAKSLLAANNCIICTVTRDPYELGVTKFSGTVAQENGTLADNAGGVHTYILPANTEIIPYDNGYYAEFPVNSFSEFWLNNGGPGGINPLPVNLLHFEAIKQAKKVLLQWSTENELNADKYLVERSTDGILYSVIGSVTALNNNQKNNYSFIDLQPAAGLNYYRLKMLDRDAAFRYSPVRRINFNNAGDDITVYPNPVVDGKLFIASSASAERALLFDAAGRNVKSYKLNGSYNTLDVSSMAKGTYQLKIFTANSFYTQRIIIQ